MCNYLREDFEPIPENGTGWKLFEVKNGNLTAPYHESKYQVNEEGFACFSKENITFRMSDLSSVRASFYDFIENRVGFCLFTDKKTAQKAKKLWLRLNYHQNLVVLQVQYRKGLGKQIEEGMFGKRFPVYTAIVKEFKPIKGWIV